MNKIPTQKITRGVRTPARRMQGARVFCTTCLCFVLMGAFLGCSSSEGRSSREGRSIATILIEVPPDRLVLFSGYAFAVEGHTLRLVNTDDRALYTFGVNIMDDNTQRVLGCIVKASKYFSNTEYSIQLEFNPSESKWSLRETGKNRYVLRLEQN
jgi:hypothetical protein